MSEEKVTHATEVRVGKVELSTKLLEDLLQLPPGNKITRVVQEVDDEYARRFFVIVEGDAMPVHREGEILAPITLESRQRLINLGTGVNVTVDEIDWYAYINCGGM